MKRKILSLFLCSVMLMGSVCGCESKTDEQKLPISRKLKDFLQYLQAYHDTMMDMDNAPEDSPWWTEEDTIMFNKKKKFAYDQLCKELGEEFEILYCCGEWS